MNSRVHEAPVQSYGGLLKNVAWLGAASVAVKPIWVAFLTVACARVLGAEGYGIFNTALSLVALTFAFADLGLGPYTVREVAADRTAAPRLFSNLVVVRVGVALLASGVALAVSIAVGHEQALFVAVAVACLYSLAYVVVDYSRVYFQAFEVLNVQAVSVVAEKVLVIAGGGLLLFWVATPQATLIGMAVGMALTAVGTSLAVHRRLVRFDRSVLDRAFTGTTLRRLLPYGASAVLGVLFFRVDTVLVEAFLGPTSAGQYGYAFRVVEALNMLPLLLLDAAAYPRLSRLARSGTAIEFRRLALGVGVALVLISVPVSAVLSMSAAFVVETTTTDPQFAASIPALAVLSWVFPLTCLRHLGYTVLLAIGEERYAAWALGAAVAINLALNAFLIPRLGVQGAVWATLASESVLLTFNAARIWYRRSARTTVH